MARKKNALLRTIVPLAAVLIGVGVVAAVAVNSGNQSGRSASPAAPPTAPTDAAPSPESAAEAGSAEDAAPVSSPTEVPVDTPEGSPTRAAAAEPALSAAPAGESPRARVMTDVPEPAPIGSLDGEGGHLLYVEFSPYGAGVRSMQLGDGYFVTVGSTDHVELQAQRSVQRAGLKDLTAVPLAALWLHVDSHPPINLASAGVWRPIEGQPGAFEAFIDDAAGSPLLRLVRRYELLPGTFRLTLTRRVESLSGRDHTVRWEEAGPIDLPEPLSPYGGDKRRVRFGYLNEARAQAGSTAVTDDNELAGRTAVLGKRGTDAAGYRLYEEVRPVWPTAATEAKGRRLVWAAFTDRYFAVALHPVLDPATISPGGEETLFRQVERIDRLVLNPYIDEPQEAVILMRVRGASQAVPAGGVAESSTGIYAGPLLDEQFDADPLLTALHLDGLIAYNFGGFCGELCTFAWLTHVLLFVLHVTHDLTGDWAAGIVILVLVVRTALHPITRWSQIRLQRFGKQMQELAPKQQKLREKYQDDPKRMQQEMARLWQEEGINPAGALGCLPMFLQSPVWIALYATLYFAAEMRHEPGFWGVFQAVSGGQWQFLADLSSPDAALPLPSFMHFTPPLLGDLYGRVTSINLLPILMGVLFYVHQKYLSPPPSASMTPEQEQQQKIMRVMFPLMMPVFMYPAPSGLVVYFITNSALAIIENKHIRASAEKQGLLDLDKIKAEKAARRASGGGGGFMARLQAMAEERQRQTQGQPGAKRVQNTSRPGKSDPTPRKFKKRK